MTMKTEMKNLDRESLRRAMEQRGQRAFRADQIFRWLYKRDAASFEEMTDLNQPLQQKLDAAFCIQRSSLVSRMDSEDGTVKMLLRFPDGAHVETVLIPDAGRVTVCVSSQVGCNLGCAFCRTGTMSCERNLETWEILEQVQAAARLNPERPVSNVVFMGMGEPLLNYEAVVAACRILKDDLGMNFSNRRITVSTVGIIPALGKLGHDVEISLAVSLHSADNATRSRLAPINKKYPLKDLIQACREFPLSNRRRITYEYTMLSGVNDSDEDAHKLRRLMAPLKAHVNLIFFNPWEGCSFRPTPEKRVREFQRILLDGKINCVVRKSRGPDILAACGQLKSKG
jgi:23S rRNA (adenine2503-C2)-methyltransferase